MRIETVKTPHRQIYERDGRLRVNNIPFHKHEAGRLISEEISERQGMLFDGHEGYLFLRDDLSVIRPARQTPEPDGDADAGEATDGDDGVEASGGQDADDGGSEDDAGDGDDDQGADGDDDFDVDARMEEARMHVVATLRTAASQLGITGATRMNKEELIEAIVSTENGRGEQVDLDAIASA